MKVDTSGLNAVALQFTKMALSAPVVVEGAQRIVAPKILEEQMTNVPILSGDLHDSLGIAWGKGTARIGAVVRGKGSAARRAHFTENGTVHHPPQPFIRPAADVYADEYARTVLRLAGRI